MKITIQEFVDRTREILERLQNEIFEVRLKNKELEERIERLEKIERIGE